MSDILSSIRLFLLTFLTCCVAYPLVVWGFASVLVPKQSLGSLIYNPQGEVIGSSLIAQSFTRPEYFWPRPSAVGYNASATGGSNLSPTNPAITQRASETIAAYNLVGGQSISADLVTTSGSGLDPHITFDAAKLQVLRVALARHMKETDIIKLIEQANDSPTLRMLGSQPLINVLELNLLLDNASKNAIITE